MSKIKKNFFTGLALVLPVVLTLLIVMFVVNVLTKPFVGIVGSLLINLGGLDYFPLMRNEQFLLFSAKILALLFLFSVLLVVGIIGQTFIVHKLLKLGDFFIHRIPLVNKVYRALQDVVKTVMQEGTESFRQAVLVPFPHKKAFAIGFLVSGKPHEETDEEKKDKFSVFLPATPNPTIGFLLLFKKEEIKHLDLSIEEAFKFVVSCGISSQYLSSKQDHV